MAKKTSQCEFSFGIGALAQGLDKVVNLALWYAPDGYGKLKRAENLQLRRKEPNPEGFASWWQIANQAIGDGSPLLSVKPRQLPCYARLYGDQALRSGFQSGAEAVSA